VVFQHPIVKKGPSQYNQVLQVELHIVLRRISGETSPDTVTDNKAADGIYAGFYADVVYGGKQGFLRISAEQGKQQNKRRPEDAVTRIA
jgi:hypothetical protein